MSKEKEVVTVIPVSVSHSSLCSLADDTWTLRRFHLCSLLFLLEYRECASWSRVPNSYVNNYKIFPAGEAKCYACSCVHISCWSSLSFGSSPSLAHGALSSHSLLKFHIIFDVGGVQCVMMHLGLGNEETDDVTKVTLILKWLEETGN